VYWSSLIHKGTTVKRSEVNRVIREAVDTFENRGIHLPAFAGWRPTEWLHRIDDVSELVEAGLGWDVVEWPPGPFSGSGLLLFTLRNVRRRQPSGYTDGYAEKLMLIRPGQRTPLHTHRRKTEDLINRGGGLLVIEFGEDTASKSHSIILNGVTQPIDRAVELRPGDSVTLSPGVYHSFIARESDVVAGEVSTYNDDEHDNVFADPMERYPRLEEDEPPERLLVADYRRVLKTLSSSNLQAE